MKIILIVSFLLLTVIIILLLLRKKRCYDDINLIQLGLKSYYKDFNQICQANNISFWADGGTLLGAVRDKGIISHDDDIDLCLTEQDYEKLNTALNNNQNYYLTASSNDLQVIKFKRRNIPSVWIDLFVMTEQDGKLVYKNPEQRKKWASFYYSTAELYPLKRIQFEDTTIPVPQNPEPYLVRGYGANWTVPVVYNRHSPD